MNKPKRIISLLLTLTLAFAMLSAMPYTVYSGIPATTTPAGTAPASWASVGGKNLTWLRDYIADTAAPLAVQTIMNTFGYLDFFKGANIQIGLQHANLNGASQTKPIFPTMPLTRFRHSIN